MLFRSKYTELGSRSSVDMRVRQGVTSGCIQTENYPLPYPNNVHKELAIPTQGFSVLKVFIQDLQVGKPVLSSQVLVHIITLACPNCIPIVDVVDIIAVKLPSQYYPISNNQLTVLSTLTNTLASFCFPPQYKKRPMYCPTLN